MAAAEHPPIEPLRPDFTVQCLDDAQLDQLQEATLDILAHVGVRFPSERALSVFAENGAQVDWQTQIVKMSPDLVRKALATTPRYPVLGARDPRFDLNLEKSVSYFTTDGCGHQTVDFETGKRRPSNKADVARMARVADYLSSIGFYWTMVSAQDCGPTAPLHELEASWNNSIKHVQSVTLISPPLVRYGLEMAQVISGDREEMRRRPPFSVVICTIAPLIQDTEAIEAAMLLAEAGIPAVFLAMPTLGTTAPATLSGALVMSDAECISAIVLMQLVAPGAPVFHSIMRAWADPRTAAYVGYPLNGLSSFAPVEMAHHWGIPAMGGAFGTDSTEPGSWQSAAEITLDPLMVGLSGAEIVTGIGLRATYTLLYPESIILDDDIYHRARYALMNMDISPDTLALDVIQKVGPGGHFLAQKHTRRHMPSAMERSLAQQLDAQSNYRDPLEVAREKVDWILKNHAPAPLEKAKQAELSRILAAAEQEIT
ncbi:MAG: trimethylamine methyltransferase family protein [Chloroflexota bacterium]|nr:MAG: trimethylamine methyltransferase family protein [Chloroflexota bacterium]